MQTLIIGDIHGCYDEMIDLINHSGICSGDCIVSVGDFGDRNRSKLFGIALGRTNCSSCKFF